MTAASDKPRYPIPWIASYFIAGLILMGGAFVAVWYASQFSSEFDYEDPDMQFLENIVLSDEPRMADFTNLNSGDWQALCLIGHKAEAQSATAAAGLEAAIASKIVSRAASRREDVKPSEFLFVYVTRAGDAKALRHPHGFAFTGEGAAQCTTSETPKLMLPVRAQ